MRRTRPTLIAASALLAALALSACGGSGDGDGFEAAASGDVPEFDEIDMDDLDLDDFEIPEADDTSSSDEDLMADFEANLDQFVADGLGLDEPLDEGGVGVEYSDGHAAPVLDGGYLTPAGLAAALDAIEAEHGAPLAPLFVRITGDQVIVAVDEARNGYVYEAGAVTTTDVGDLGTFGPEPLAAADLDVDLETLVLKASDDADFDPGLAVEVTVGRSRLDSDLAFARIIVWTEIEGYADVDLDGELLTDNVM